MTSQSVYDALKEFAAELGNSRNRKRDYGIANALLSKLDGTMSDFECTAKLEDDLLLTKAKKEHKKAVIQAFYRHYEEKTGKKIETNLADYIVIDDPTMRRIAMLKYFQDHKCKTEEIAQKFMLDRRTASSDLRALEDGIPIMDTTLGLNLERDGWRYYTKWSTHPIFLNLDLTETIAMTVGLMKLGNTDPLYAPQFRRIAQGVYSQLSEYAKGKLLRYMKQQGVESEFSVEMETHEKQVSSDLITMLKAECPGTIKLSSEGKEYIFADCCLSHYDNGVITITTANHEEKRFPVEDVFSCEYHLDREYSE